MSAMIDDCRCSKAMTDYALIDTLKNKIIK
jgi:hypothetical protein